MPSWPRWMPKRVRIALLVLVVLALGGGGFLAYRIGKFGPPTELQLHSMKPDGSDARLISRGISLAGGPASWSEDGKTIAFEKQGDICLIDADGSNERCVTEGPAKDELPSLSPDGSRITFSSESDKGLGIWLVDSDGSGRRLLSNKTDWGPVWSPDGSTIAFTSGRKGAPGIYLIAADGSGSRRITRSRHESGGEFSEDTMGSWSPDGSKIAFTSTRTGGPAVYTMDADGSDQKRLIGGRSDTDEDADAPAWSPAGDVIAFQRGLGSTFEIWLIRPDGTGLRRLTDNKFADMSPSWSPDGRTITFMSTRSL